MNNFIRFSLVFLVIAAAAFGIMVATKMVELNAASLETLARVAAVVVIVAVAGGLIYLLAKGKPAK